MITMEINTAREQQLFNGKNFHVFIYNKTESISGLHQHDYYEFTIVLTESSTSGSAKISSIPTISRWFPLRWLLRKSIRLKVRFLAISSPLFRRFTFAKRNLTNLLNWFPST